MSERVTIPKEMDSMLFHCRRFCYDYVCSVIPQIRRRTLRSSWMIAGVISNWDVHEAVDGPTGLIHNVVGLADDVFKRLGDVATVIESVDTHFQSLESKRNETVVALQAVKSDVDLSANQLTNISQCPACLNRSVRLTSDSVALQDLIVSLNEMGLNETMNTDNIVDKLKDFESKLRNATSEVLGMKGELSRASYDRFVVLCLFLRFVIVFCVSGQA